MWLPNVNYAILLELWSLMWPSAYSTTNANNDAKLRSNVYMIQPMDIASIFTL
jgi:hypothetical protein